MHFLAEDVLTQLLWALDVFTLGCAYAAIILVIVDARGICKCFFQNSFFGHGTFS